jgi:hypothetical protein
VLLVLSCPAVRPAALVGGFISPTLGINIFTYNRYGYNYHIILCNKDPFTMSTVIYVCY